MHCILDILVSLLAVPVMMSLSLSARMACPGLYPTILKGLESLRCDDYAPDVRLSVSIRESRLSEDGSLMRCTSSKNDARAVW